MFFVLIIFLVVARVNSRAIHQSLGKQDELLLDEQSLGSSEQSLCLREEQSEENTLNVKLIKRQSLGLKEELPLKVKLSPQPSQTPYSFK